MLTEARLCQKRTRKEMRRRDKRYVRDSYRQNWPGYRSLRDRLKLEQEERERNQEARKAEANKAAVASKALAGDKANAKPGFLRRVTRFFRRGA